MISLLIIIIVLSVRFGSFFEGLTLGNLHALSEKTWYLIRIFDDFQKADCY